MVLLIESFFFDDGLVAVAVVVCRSSPTVLTSLMHVKYKLFATFFILWLNKNCITCTHWIFDLLIGYI